MSNYIDQLKHIEESIPLKEVYDTFEILSQKLVESHERKY